MRQLPYKDRELAPLLGEKWKDIPGLEGYFKISNLGRVKRLSFSLATKAGWSRLYDEKIAGLNTFQEFNKSKQDYKIHLTAYVGLNNVQHSISIGRLVYYCFVKKFDLSNKGLLVTYKDGNGLNVVPKNLELVDGIKMQKRAFKIGRRAYFEPTPEVRKKLSEKGIKVSQYDLDGRYIATFDNAVTAAKETSASASHIRLVAKKQGVSSGNFIWRYRDDKKNLDKKDVFKRKTRGHVVSSYNTKTGRKIKTYEAIAQAAKILGVSRKSISRAIDGQRKTSGNMYWRVGAERFIKV